MKTDNQGVEKETSRQRGGVVSDDKSKGADFSEDPMSGGDRGGVLADDRAKSASADSQPETARPRGGAVGDDRSKGLEDHPKA